MQKITVRCCIAGGGPAGVMAGLLLARAGIDVVVLEKHGDFFRDFRGDTIHPSTLELMHELGMLEEFLALPHQKADHLSFQFAGATGVVADFKRVKLRCPFVAFMPQWDFLDFLSRRAARYPTFALKMSAEATGLLEENGRVVGVTATTPHGPLEARADLVIAADGRHSLLREKAGLAVTEFGAPMDVLWFSLPRASSDPDETMGRFEPGCVLVAIDRRDYWQIGFVIPKGAIGEVKRRGLPAFRAQLQALAPYLSDDRVAQIDEWEKVKLLTVQVNRAARWHRPGFLAIGDAAHAMSPIGGVGINLAIQDAVAATNILAAPLAARSMTEADLARVQKRREFPTRVIQAGQIAIQNRVLSRVLSGSALKPPLLARLLRRFPALRGIPARLIGVGVRPEHVMTAPRWPEKEPAVQG